MPGLEPGVIRYVLAKFCEIKIFEMSGLEHEARDMSKFHFVKKKLKDQDSNRGESDLILIILSKTYSSILVLAAFF